MAVVYKGEYWGRKGLGPDGQFGKNALSGLGPDGHFDAVAASLPRQMAA
jgi:hypothetical protein